MKFWLNNRCDTVYLLARIGFINLLDMLSSWMCKIRLTLHGLLAINNSCTSSMACMLNYEVTVFGVNTEKLAVEQKVV